MAKMNLLVKPLQRITTGGILAALSFAICGVIQLKIEADFPITPSANFAHLTIVNGLPCDLEISNPEFFGDSKAPLKAFDIIQPKDFNVTLMDLNLQISSQFNSNDKCNISGTFDEEIKRLHSEDIAIAFIHFNEFGNISLSTYESKELLHKPESGGANVRIVFNLLNGFDSTLMNSSFVFANNKFSKSVVPSRDGNYSSFGETDYTELDVSKGGHYSLEMFVGDNNRRIIINSDLPFQQGGSYIVVVYGTPQQVITLMNTLKT